MSETAIHVELDAHEAESLLNAWYGGTGIDHRAAESAARKIEDALTATATPAEEDDAVTSV